MNIKNYTTSYDDGSSKSGANGKAKTKKKWGRIVATYDYCDADGKLVYQTVRLADPKNFMQRKPDGKGGWGFKNVFKGDGCVPRVLYRWPELLKYPDAPVFICEGEKDTDRVRLLDLNPVATSVAGQCWTPELADALKGRDVYILQDNDAAGREVALEAAALLFGKAKSIRIVELPGLPEKGDASDWLNADTSRSTAELVAECLKVQEWNGTDFPLGDNQGNAKREASTGCGGNGIALGDFIAYLPTHQYYHVPTGAMWAAISINTKINGLFENGKEISASTWLDKHHCAVQTTWMPGEPLEIKDRVINDGGWIDHPGVTCLNLYRPPNVAPGDSQEAGPWIEHCIKVYGELDANRMLDWFAHRVQRPHEKINHALFLGGSPGIGKDTLLAPVINAIGPWNAQDIAPKTLLGQFNTYARAVILRVSETHDLGDVNRYTFYDASKVYCASPPDFLRVNQKHMQEFYVKNVCGVIFTSNYRDGLYLPEDDRRHDIMWSELVAADFADGYWTKLWSWYSDGGNEHVASYLMSRDISKFNPAAPPPKGPAFWAIVDSSAAPEDSEFGDLLDCITHDLVDMEDGGWPAAVTLSQVRRYADEPMKAWIDDRRNRRSVPHRFDKCGYVPVRNNTRKEGNWIVLKKRQVIYAKKELSLRARYEAAEALVKANQ
jgi:hypothetical protein